MRLPEPFSFFIDRSLGGDVVASALRAAGEQVVVHSAEFDDDAPDILWLTAVGAKKWVVLTKDARIRTNALERDALLRANVAAFMLGRGDVVGARMADVPLIGSVSVDGAVAMLYVDGTRLERARPVRG